MIVKFQQLNETQYDMDYFLGNLLNYIFLKW